MEIAWVIAYASQASIAIPLLSLFRIRDFKATLAVSFTLLVLVSLIADTLSTIEDLRGNSNIYIVNVYYALQFLLISFAYAKLLARLRKVVYFLVAGFSVYFLIATYSFQDIYSFQSLVQPVEGGILIFFSCLYWYEIYTTEPTQDLRYFPPFWFNSGVFVYFSMNLFLFVIYAYITNLSNEAAMAFWIWHNLNNIIKNGLFAVGIFYMKRN